ncbi:MAG: hypothetical protein AAB433_06375 [Nitrospirota bacterium]
MKRWTLPLALATAAVYLTLSFSAAACLFTHQAQPRSTHHHSGGATHSLLCAWACQANQPADGPFAAPDSQPLALAALFLSVASMGPSLFLTYLAQSRAPPRF